MSTSTTRTTARRTIARRAVVVLIGLVAAAGITTGTSGTRTGSASSSPSTTAEVTVPDATVITPAETAADPESNTGGGAGTFLPAGAALAVVGALTVGGITLARRRNA